MCDDLTAHEEDTALAASGLNRRQFAVISAARGVGGLHR